MKWNWIIKSTAKKLSCEFETEAVTNASDALSSGAEIDVCGIIVIINLLLLPPPSIITEIIVWIIGNDKCRKSILDDCFRVLFTAVSAPTVCNCLTI